MKNRQNLTCEGKAKHDSKRAAENVKFSLIRNRGARSLQVYKCKKCDGWHVGHPPGSLRKR